MPNHWNYGRYRETGGGQSIAVAEASKVTLDLDTNDEQDSGFSRSGGTITLIDAGHYLVAYNIGIDTSGGNRQCYVAAVFLDDVEVPDYSDFDTSMTAWCEFWGNIDRIQGSYKYCRN